MARLFRESVMCAQVRGIEALKTSSIPRAIFLPDQKSISNSAKSVSSTLRMFGDVELDGSRNQTCHGDPTNDRAAAP
jgi:hypothetical protein